MFSNNIINLLSYFIFLYPVLMSIVWTLGGLIFWWNRERKSTLIDLNDNEWPNVTILVPCHNEEAIIQSTCNNLLNIDYPNLEVIFIDDASTDQTSSIIQGFVNKVPNIHLLRLEKNLGKANALNKALQLIRSKYVLIVDADTTLDRNAVKWLAEPFTRLKDIGAVTANVLIRNKDNYLGKFQAAEFTCIVGLIKRCQRVLGAVFTVSGCATLYHVPTLMKVGGFSPNTATEDVDITWKIQKLSKKVLFQPRAKVYIQVPLKISQYLRQRKRWATGGWHLLRQHWNVLSNPKMWSLGLVYIEFAISYLWAFCFIALSLIGTIYILLSPEDISRISFWSGAVTSLMFIFQAAIAIYINLKYDSSLIGSAFWICWYPILFFIIGAVEVIVTSPKGLFGNIKESGKWRSPSREQIKSVRKL